MFYIPKCLCESPDSSGLYYYYYYYYYYHHHHLLFDRKGKLYLRFLCNARKYINFRYFADDLQILNRILL